MRAILNWVFRWLEHLCKLIMVVQVVTTAIVVTGRYLLNSTPSWGDPLAIFLLVWLGMLGAAVTVRENAHIRVTFIETLVSARWVRAMSIFSDIVMLAFTLLLAYAGFQLVLQQWNTNYPGINISKSWLYAAVPTACVFFLVGVIENLVDALRGRPLHEGGSAL